MKFASKPIPHYPAHLRHVATLPWDIKNFRDTVLLLVYFYDQFVAPKIRHSTRHCIVCQQSTGHSVTRTRF